MAKKNIAVKKSRPKTNMIGGVTITAAKKKKKDPSGELTKSQESYRRTENKKRTSGGKLGTKKVTASEARKARPSVKKKK
jgi:hypothetical protein